MDNKERLFRYLSDHSFPVPPTVRELCGALSIKSTSTVFNLLHQLEAEGAITIHKGKRRNITVNHRRPVVDVPLLGSIAAGEPIEAVQDIERYIPIERPLGASGRLFALRVQGDSMVDAGILDRDIIIAAQAETAEDGEIVVALLQDEATVKRMYRKKEGVELRPANPSYQPIVVDEVAVLGRVLLSMRYYD